MMTEKHEQLDQTSSEHQQLIKLPNGVTAKGVLLQRGMANLQKEAEQADFSAQTKAYLAWMNDLNGNRFGIKVTDAADRVLVRHTQFLDDVIKELAYADAPANAELTPDDYKPARNFYVPSAGLIALVAALQWAAQHERQDVVVYSTHRRDLVFYQPRHQATFLQQWAQQQLQKLPPDFRFRIATKLDRDATHETTKLRMQL
ncbi:hypothetical protein [Lacticaseibacillus casei]|uniref:hypothetical protein n=1 Tax=Lacticaseibacillus casei TaxID=1582 RepID=UPI0014875ECC|nr:hypothetical protein [Lacticaseibacillus casei]